MAKPQRTAPKKTVPKSKRQPQPMKIYIVHQLDEEDRKLLCALARAGEKVANEIERLTTEVEEIKTVHQGAITLIEGLAQAIRDAGTDKAKLKALADDLDNSANTLSAAVTANTPAETLPGDGGNP